MKRRQLSPLGAVAVSLALTGAALLPALSAHAQAAPAVGAQDGVESYRIKPGDSLSIVVFEKPDLGRQVTVPPDGKISYPFMGEVKVAGATLEEIRVIITKGLSKELSNPKVDVQLSSRTKAEVSVLGAVRNPGNRTLGDGWHLLDLISAANGLSVARPEWAKGSLVRGDGIQIIPIDLDKLMQGDPAQNIALMPGDKFLVRELDARNFFMQILGEVKRIGNVEVPKDGSFFDIFTNVGGFQPRAALSKVRLTRKGQTVVLDMRNLMTTGEVKLVGDGKGVITAETLRAEPGDTLIIPTNELTYTVMGGVTRTGRFEYPDSGKLTVLEALTQAGSAIPTADLKAVTVLRKGANPDKPDMIELNLESLMKPADPKKRNSKTPVDPAGAVAKDIAMQPDDILVVPVKATKTSSGFGLQNVLGMLPFIGFLAR